MREQEISLTLKKVWQNVLGKIKFINKRKKETKGKFSRHIGNTLIPQEGGGGLRKKLQNCTVAKIILTRDYFLVFKPIQKSSFFFRFSGSLFFAIDSIVRGVSSTDSAETRQSWLV